MFDSPMPEFMSASDYKRFFYNPDPYNTVGLIVDGVKKGMAPWDPGRVDVFIHTNLRSDEILIEPHGPLSAAFRYPIDPFDQMRLDPRQLALKVAEAAFKFYRYRPALPVDDHIILGEN